MLSSLAAAASTLAWVTGLLVWLIIAAIIVSWLAARLRERAMLDMRGRWVAVTGCDSGLGRDAVDVLVARGARVVACCYTEEGVQAALGAGASAAFRADLSAPSEVDALAQQIDGACGGALWSVVHNAGIALPGFVEYQPASFYRRVMEVNFFAPVRLTQLLLPALRRAQGRVVIVSSVDGLVSLPGNAPYDASKFAVEAYADALGVELDDAGVAVSVVNPATMKTPLALQFFAQHRRAWDEMDRLDPDGSWKALYPASWLDEYIDANTQNLARIAQDPRHAVEDIAHAVCARAPRWRYLSGTMAKTLFYGLWIAPERWAHAFKKATIQPPPPQTP